MPLPLVIPAISAITEGAAYLAAALGLTAGTALAIKNSADNQKDIREELIKRNYDKINKNNQVKPKSIPSAENALVWRPEYRTVTTPVEYIGYKPIWETQTSETLTEPVVEFVWDGETYDRREIEDDQKNKNNPNDPNDQNDRKGWLDKYRQRRRERLETEKRKLETEKERLKITRERIDADKAYQEFLRSQGRSIPRPSAWTRPISQGVPKFLGGKGPATTNRFYNSPAMGTLEWVGVDGGVGWSGYEVGKWLLNDDNDDKKSTEIDMEGTEKHWDNLKKGVKIGQ